MEVEFKDNALDRLETDPRAPTTLPQPAVRAFWKRMQFIRSAVDERDFRQMKSLHFEKLKGARKSQYSMRLNDQYRLILEFKKERNTKTVSIVSIEDYH